MLVEKGPRAAAEAPSSTAMTTPTQELPELLRALEPKLHEGVYAFVSLPSNAHGPELEPLATFREQEGLTLVLREEEALAAGLPVLFRAAWISLTVHSDLEAVGLTAAFATALAKRGISCNVMAGAYHDHLFVPTERSAEALGCLRGLQEGG